MIPSIVRTAPYLTYLEVKSLVPSTTGLHGRTTWYRVPRHVTGDLSGTIQALSRHYRQPTDPMDPTDGHCRLGLDLESFKLLGCPSRPSSHEGLGGGRVTRWTMMGARRVAPVT